MNPVHQYKNQIVYKTTKTLDLCFDASSVNSRKKKLKIAGKRDER